METVLVGCKIDLDHNRMVRFDSAANYAKDNGMQYYETSSKTGQGIDEVFNDFFKQIIDKHYDDKPVR